MGLPKFAPTILAKKHRFLALMVTQHTVQAVLWIIDQGKISIEKTSSVYTYTDPPNCIIKADQSLQELGPSSEGINKVIFAFEANWVSEEGIADEAKPLLKRLTEELSLEPVGFVVVTEAIVQHYQQLQKMFNAVLMYVTAQKVSVSVIDKGEIVKAETVGRSADPASDLLEALARFTKNQLNQPSHLPTKLIVVSAEYQQDELERVRQQLLEADWQGTHSFAHIPVIEVCDAAQLLHIIVEQGGLSLAQAKGWKVEKGLMPVMDAETDELEPSDLGFAEVKSSSEHSASVLNSDKGDGDPVPETVETETEDDESEESSGKTFWQHYRWFILSGFGLGLVVIAAVLFLLIGALAKAKAVVTLDTKTISKETTVTVDPSVSQSQPTEGVIKATLSTEPASGQSTVETTGVKLTGEAAKGTITLLNKTNSVKKFGKGTIVTANNLQFTLDDDVEVASASVKENSSGDGETKTYGKAEGKVTASKIGAEGNITKTTNLSIADFAESTYDAEAIADFTGGASREIRVVSSEDQQKLLTQLKKKLTDDVASKIKTQEKTGEYRLVTGRTKQAQAEFDAKVGEEAKDLTLDLSLEVEVMNYQAEDLKALAKEVLTSDVPNGYVLAGDDPQILSQPTEMATDSAKVVLSANLSAVAKAKVDAEGLKAEIKGLSVSNAQSRLQSKPGVKAVEITFYPAWVQALPVKLPAKAEAITFEEVVPNNE